MRGFASVNYHERNFNKGTSGEEKVMSDYRSKMQEEMKGQIWWIVHVNQKELWLHKIIIRLMFHWALARR